MTFPQYVKNYFLFRYNQIVFIDFEIDICFTLLKLFTLNTRNKNAPLS